VFAQFYVFAVTYPGHSSMQLEYEAYQQRHTHLEHYGKFYLRCVFVALNHVRRVPSTYSGHPLIYAGLYY